MNKILSSSAAVLLSMMMGAGLAATNLPSKPVLTLAAAERIADAAQRAATDRKSTVVIAVVDDGGYPLLLRRLDDTQPASVDVAIAKARTAAIFRRPSAVFEDQVANGRIAALGLPGAVPLKGGLPLVHAGVVIGAVGVSGNTPEIDENIAAAGVQAFGRPSFFTAVEYFSADRVAAFFAKGLPILEIDNYKIHASRREGVAGQAEVHERDTDIIHVLEGTATFVTGGAAVDLRSTAIEELRGSGIHGGTTHELKPNDVIVVPAGTPHQFTRTTKPFLYYVVKVRSPGGVGR
jgi:uncharacterized protein GlcG (DUF336 family)